MALTPPTVTGHPNAPRWRLRPVLTPARWGLLVALLVVAAAMQPRSAFTGSGWWLSGWWSSDWDRRVAASRLRAEAAAREQFAAIDAARDAAGRTPGLGLTVLRTGAGAVDTTRRANLRQLDSLWRAMVPSSARFAMVVAAPPPVRSGERPVQALWLRWPWADPRGGCLLLDPTLGGGANTAWTRRRGEPFRRGALSACAMTARLGMPGPAVRRWLGATGLVAYEAAPLSPDETGWRRQGGMRESQLAARAENFSLSMAACAMGDLAACGRAAAQLHLRTGPRDLAMQATAFMTRDVGPIGVGETPWMTRLEQALGPDRFARVWRADGDFDQALRAATGEGLDRWLQRLVQDELRGVPWSMRAAASAAEARTLPVLLLLFPLAIGAAVGLAARRQG